MLTASNIENNRSRFPVYTLQARRKRYPLLLDSSLLQNIHSGSLSKFKKTLKLAPFRINEVDKNGHSLLMYAIILNQLNFVEYMLENKVDLSAQDKNGLSALSIAIKYKHNKIVDLLFKANAPLNLVDNENKKPIEHAIANGNYYAVQLLSSK